MRVSRLSIAAGVAFLIFHGVALSQSLGEVARKTAQERQKVKTPSKVYTNEDLKREPGGNTVSPGPAVGVPAAAEAKPATPAATEPPKPPAKDAAQEPAKDQKYWKGRMTEAEAQLARSNVLLAAMQSRVNALNTDFTNMSDPAQRAVIERDRQKAIAELERLKKDIQASTKSIADTLEEARRANVPPGWLR
jgi:hypothetical protein